jgi:hypothetical protein
MQRRTSKSTKAGEPEAAYGVDVKTAVDDAALQDG